MEYKIPLDEAIWQALEGRCISCGYLGKRSHILPKVYEATDHDRSYFSFVTNALPPPTYPGTYPCCFVNELSLAKEFRNLDEKYQGAKDNGQISFEITTRDINCTKWIPYKPLMSPKEHFEEFKEEINRREHKRTNRIMIGLTIVTIIIAAIAAYASLASIYPEHWLFSWLH